MTYEKNIVVKNLGDIDLRLALCYPNVYKTASSSLGYNLLYDYANSFSHVYAERVIYPNTRSIETGSPLKDFDIISFTIHFEEDYMKVIEMLKTAGIPIKRKDRSSADPLIIAGGPTVTANPKPLNEFIDIFIIGEGEGVLESVFNNYLENGKNLESYLKIKGIYISKFDNPTKINLVEDMNTAHHVENPIIYDSENVFKDSIMLNVSRGCTRGCRFCMTSFIYRPMRETNIDYLVKTALKLKENTGLNRVVLIGAAVSDYSKITELILELEKNDFEISTPSLRLESITKQHLEILQKTNLKTITIAPESIYKLRKSMNKDVSDEKIFEIVKNAFDLGFNMKLYFIIGLPGESVDDIYQLIDFMKEIASLKNGNKVSFSINPLIPKPQTPLQWESYDIKDIKKKMRIIKKEMKNYNIKTDSPKQGLIQYILSCGGSEIAPIIEKTTFEKPTLKEWKEYLPSYSLKSPLPWDNIDVGISKRFLLKEYEKIKNSITTPWCVSEKCYNCGVCKK